MLSHVPMLRVQRDLLDIPRGLARFRRYLEVMVARDGEVLLPLQAFNPMARPHVAERLDHLIALDAETEVARAVAEADRRWGTIPESLRVGLVIADDHAGGWTDRALMEVHGLRVVPRASHARGWLVALCWSSETGSLPRVREAVLSAVFRHLWLVRRGVPATLRGVLDLEGRALAFAGASGPTLDPDDLAYTREVIRPHLDTDDFPVMFACLQGDAQARRVGYTPLGLSERAGLALALADAVRAKREGPIGRTTECPVPSLDC